MKNLVYLAILIVIFTTCQEFNNVRQIEITNIDKINFLNEILLDTNGLAIIDSKQNPISNYFPFVPPVMPLKPPFYINSINHSEYIALALGIDSIKFVKEQMEANRDLDLGQLAKYGFKIFDLAKCVKYRLNFDSLADVMYGREYDYNSILKISKPFFNRDLTVAHIMIQKDFRGETLILEKISGVWKKKKSMDKWIE